MVRVVKIRYAVDTADAVASTKELTSHVNKHKVAIVAASAAMKKMVGVGLGTVIALATTGIAVAGFTKHLLSLAGTMETISKSFESVAKNEGLNYIHLLEDLQEASFGTITSLELMRKANQAAFLGLDISRLDDMLKIAKGAAQAMGQSFEYMFESLVLGIGRQQKLILDNLGIIFTAEEANKKYARSVGKVASELTDVERRQAFLNMAMDKGLANLEKMGGLSLTTSDRMVSLNVAWKDLRLELSEIVAPLARIKTFFAGIVVNITDVVKALKDMNRATAEIKLERLEKEAERLRKILGAGFTTVAAPPAGAGFQPGFKIPTPGITMPTINFSIAATAVDKLATGAGRFAEIMDEMFKLRREIAGQPKLEYPLGALTGEDPRFAMSKIFIEPVGDLTKTFAEGAKQAWKMNDAMDDWISRNELFVNMQYALADGINETFNQIVSGTATFKGAMLNIWNSLLSELLAQTSVKLASQIAGTAFFGNIFGATSRVLDVKVQSTDPSLIAGQLQYYYSNR